jgi:hypothetical protein
LYNEGQVDPLFLIYTLGTVDTVPSFFIYGRTKKNTELQASCVRMFAHRRIKKDA